MELTKNVQTKNINTTALYYISDYSYHQLVTIAEQQGYIRRGGQRYRGISNFFNDLSKCDFSDTRPSQVIKRHAYEIKVGRAPLWMSHYIRRTRSLTLSKEAKQNYIHLAGKVGIIKDEPFIYGGPVRTSFCSIIGYVLESIGLKWITPAKLPIKTTGNLSGE
jgi:hypothetical protein